MTDPLLSDRRDAPDILAGQKAPAASIVIVNWNSGVWLSNCLASIAEHGHQSVVEVIVVDNGSTDGSDHAQLGTHPLRIVRTGENLGFAKACNLGATYATAPYLLFLNPDAALHQNNLQSVLQFMESAAGRDIGVCGIRLDDETGQTQRHTTRFATARSIFLHSQMITPFDHLASRYVDHVIGAFYLVRRDLFEAVGGFDERFFVYFEDLDLSLRIRKAGWKIYYYAETTGFHKGGGTSDQVKAHRLFYSMRSRTLYAFKHFAPAKAWAVAVGLLTLEPAVRVVRSLRRASSEELVDTLRGSLWYWAEFPRIIKCARV